MIKRVVFLSFSAAASATSFNNIINTEPMLSYQLVFTSFFLYYYYCYFGVFLSLTLPMADSLAPVFSARVIAPYEGRSCLVWILSGSLKTHSQQMDQAHLYLKVSVNLDKLLSRVLSSSCLASPPSHPTPYDLPTHHIVPPSP